MSVIVPEETAEELYEHAPCGYLSSLPDGTIVRVNQTLLDWTGYSRSLLLGKRFSELLPVPARIFYETHYAPLLRLQGFIREMALDLVCATGPVLPVLLNSVQHRDKLGEPVMNRTTVFDATERRTYERELLRERRRAEQLAEVVQMSADAILIASPAGVVQTWNAGAQHLFGYSAEEAIGASIQQLIVPQEYIAEFSQLLQLVQSGEQVQLETVRARKDGTRVEVSLSLTPHVEPPGELIAISAITRDITERRREEARLRQTERLRAVATLAGGVAHEVNNQMAVVLGFGDFVLQALGESHPQSTDVRAMVEASAKVAHLSRQLLAFSRQLPMTAQGINLSHFVDTLTPMLNGILGPDKRVVVVPRPADAQVYADPAEIEHVLVQLAMNARDALPAGGQLILATERVRLAEPDLELGPGEEVMPGSYVVLSVSDNGSGMDEVTLGRAFEPFFTTKPFGSGTGLGLAVVHGIVKQHGGHVRISSTPGQGTSFDIYLPEMKVDGSPGAVGTSTINTTLKPAAAITSHG